MGCLGSWPSQASRWVKFMRKRKHLSKRVRFEVFKRDGFTCQYCGRTPPEVLLQVDHILALANGGDDDPDNLITACADCNLGKSNVPLGAIPSSLASEFDRKAEMTAQVEAYNDILMAIRESREHWICGLARHWYDAVFPDEPGEWTFNQQRLATVKRFLNSLPAANIHEAMDIALSKPLRFDENRCWRYFFGVCWRMIKGEPNG